MAVDLTPDPEAARERVMGEPDEKPRRTSTERVHRHRARKRAARAAATPAAEGEQAPAEIVVSPGDVSVAIEIGETVWELTRGLSRCRSLDPAQKERLGVALAPLVQKYMPLLGAWQYEIGAGLVLFALVRECRLPAEVKGAAKAETETKDGAGQGPSDGAGVPAA